MFRTAEEPPGASCNAIATHLRCGPLPRPTTRSFQSTERRRAEVNIFGAAFANAAWSTRSTRSSRVTPLANAARK